MAKKVLVAVYSASGVTRRVGQAIAKVSGGDFFEIVPKEIYTAEDLNWMNKKSRSDMELHKNVSGDVKWEKGVQINRPNEGTIRKWLDKVL